MERVYTVPLGEAYKVAPKKRARRVVQMIRDFTIKNMKVDAVKVTSNLNEEIWKHGVQKPPRELKLQMVEDEEERGEKKIKVAWVELAGIKFDLAAMKEKKKEKAKKKEETKKAKEEAAKKEEEDAKKEAEKAEEKEKEQKERPKEVKKETKKTKAAKPKKAKEPEKKGE